jgi:L-ascorbate metabolism protein UlaG (beta-lactamase superfamily)
MEAAGVGDRRGEGGSLTFVGTATTVLRLGGFTVLTDPNFVRRGERVHLGYGLTAKRLSEPAVRIGELPALDAVLLSHLHGDHFDRVAKRDLPREPPVVTTPHAARRLQRWGFGAATGLATWDDWEVVRGDERLRVTAVPARHGPVGVHRLLPPVDGRQGTDLVELIEPATVVPVHYDDYPVFRSPLEHFVAEMRRRGHDARLRTVARGDTVELAPRPTSAPSRNGPSR